MIINFAQLTSKTFKIFTKLILLPKALTFHQLLAQNNFMNSVVLNN